jgi:hypothetical protein
MSFVMIDALGTPGGLCGSAARESQHYSFPRGVTDVYTVRVHGIQTHQGLTGERVCSCVRGGGGGVLMTLSVANVI